MFSTICNMLVKCHLSAYGVLMIFDNLGKPLSAQPLSLNYKNSFSNVSILYLKYSLVDIIYRLVGMSFLSKNTCQVLFSFIYELKVNKQVSTVLQILHPSTESSLIPFRSILLPIHFTYRAQVYLFCNTSHFVAKSPAHSDNITCLNNTYISKLFYLPL